MTVSTGSVNTLQTFQNISSVLLSPNGSQMYWIVAADPAVEAVQEGATTPSKVYDVGGTPSWLAVSPDGGTLYSAGSNGGIWATSTANGTATVELEGQAAIVAIGVSTDGSTLYALIGDILDDFNPRMMFVNASTGAVETTVDMPACTASYFLGSIAVSPDGKAVYAMYCGPTAVFDTATQSLAATITSTNVGTLALSPKGNLLFASSGGAENNPSSISVFDTATGKLTGTIPLSTTAMAFSPDGAHAYIGTTENNVAGIAVVDTSTLAVTDFIPGVVPGYSPESIAVTPDGRLVWVGGPNGGVIDAKTLRVAGTFKPGSPLTIH
jgi:DNA-binding beta-propeller fold protein YncE